jgi:hypothetical protein
MRTLLDPNNRLFTLTRSACRLPHILVAVALSLVFVFGSALAGSIAGGLLLGPLLSAGPVPAEIGAELRNMLIFGLMALLLTLWLRWFEGRRLWTLGLERAPIIRRFLRRSSNAELPRPIGITRGLRVSTFCQHRSRTLRSGFST